MRTLRLHLEVYVTLTKWELCFHFDVRVSPINERHISTSDEVRVPKAIWSLRLQDLRSVFASAVSSTVHWREQMTIYSGSTVHQPQLRAPRRFAPLIQTLTVIISDSFKEFNSTLTKIKIQTRLSSRYPRRLPVQSWEVTTSRKIQNISKPIPVNRRVFKTL